MENNKSRKQMTVKSRLLLISLLLILTVTVGGTLAYIVDATQEVTNIFTPSEVKIELQEKFDGTKKENVAIQNKGDTDIYVRVRLICNWYRTVTDDDGNETVQLAGKSNWTIPDGTINRTDWTEKGGYYYYNNVLKAGKDGSGDITKNLIDSITLIKDAGDGTYQALEILAEGIQAEGVNADGESAMMDAWKQTIPQETTGN